MSWVGTEQSPSQDAHWLEVFKASRSEEAFQALVKKYLGMVYGVALRRTGRPLMAEEVAQNVFAALARRASQLTARPSLAGWLYRSTLIESSELLRRERTHERKMKAFSDHSQHVMNGNSVWREVLPILDESIDALPALDRDLLLQRFFERKSFREIGQALGKSEDAAQKQCERILGRLSQILSRKGVALSTALLAAGLPSQLGQAAPAGLGVALSKATLAGVSTMDAKFVLLKSLQLMAHTKTKTALAAVVLAALPLSWQWNQNRDLQHELALVKEQLALAESALRKVPAIAPAFRQTRPSQALSMMAAATENTDGRTDAQRSTPEAWEQALLEPDPVQRTLRISALLESMTGELAPAVADLFDRMSETGRRFDAEHHLFLRAWGRLDGPAAVTRVFDSEQRSGNSTTTMAALAGWASVNPHQAQSWIESQPDSQRKERLIYGLLDGWSMVDFHSAAAYAQSRPRSEARDEFRRLLLERSLAAGGVPAAQSWFQGIPDDTHNELYKERAFHEVVRAMLYRDPAAAAAWISQQSDPRFLRGGAITETAAKLAKTAPTEALSWLESLQGAAPEARQNGMSSAISSWARQDASAAGTYLRQNAQHPHYDAMAGSFANAIVKADPQMALEWARSVREESHRSSSLLSVARQWYEQEGESALAKLRNAGVSSELIAQAREHPSMGLKLAYLSGGAALGPYSNQEIHAEGHGRLFLDGVAETRMVNLVEDVAYAYSFEADPQGFLEARAKKELTRAEEALAQAKEAERQAVSLKIQSEVDSTAASAAAANQMSDDVFLNRFIQVHGSAGTQLNCAQCHQ